MRKVVIVGPAHPLRGGLATFDHRLAREVQARGDEVSIFSFSLQYPALLFPGKTQFTEEPPPENLDIFPLINSINPFNWVHAGRRLRRLAPDLVIVRFWLPFMGPALGTLLRVAKKGRLSVVIALTDNVIPHEHRPGDRAFTRYFLGPCDAFVTMSENVLRDLRVFVSGKPMRLAVHPLYDNFGEALPKPEARQHLGIAATGRLILFFGFIRAYKGLDILLRAMADPRIRQAGIRLLVAGEFYEEENRYRALIDDLGIRDLLILRTDFIPDGEVRYYLSAADMVVQPYRQATQSGVTPLAYHFEKPMVVTNVGGLPALVPDGRVGVVTDPDPGAIASGILRVYETGEDHFIPHLRAARQAYSWSALLDTFYDLADEVSRGT